MDALSLASLRLNQIIAVITRQRFSSALEGYHKLRVPSKTTVRRGEEKLLKGGSCDKVVRKDL